MSGRARKGSAPCVYGLVKERGSTKRVTLHPSSCPNRLRPLGVGCTLFESAAESHALRSQGGCLRMYRDVVQWSKIRHRILVQGRSIRRVASEKRMDPRTIRKMLDNALPQPYGPRSHRYPKLAPH